MMKIEEAEKILSRPLKKSYGRRFCDNNDIIIGRCDTQDNSVAIITIVNEYDVLKSKVAELEQQLDNVLDKVAKIYDGGDYSKNNEKIYREILGLHLEEGLDDAKD